MGSASQLSFLPDDYMERKAQRRANAICAVLFLVVIGGIGSAFTFSERAARDLDTKYSAIDEQYVNEARHIDQVRKMQEKQQRMAHQAELTASLLEKVPRRYVLAEITNLKPDPISLLDLSLDSRMRTKAASPGAVQMTAYEQKKAAREASQNNKATAADPTPSHGEPRVYDVSIKLSGVAYTDVQVAQYLNSLSRSKLFKDVNLVVTDEFKIDEQSLRKFQIEMQLNTDADVSGTDDSSVANTGTTAVEVKE